jgi:hypothetical protein
MGKRRRRIAIIGGGASGMFAAASATDAALSRLGRIRSQRPVGDDDDDPSSEGGSSSGDVCDVIVFEGTSKTMSKVR